MRGRGPLVPSSCVGSPYDAARAMLHTEAAATSASADAMQRGLLYYYPAGPIPTGRINDALGAVPFQSMLHANGSAPIYNWKKTNSWQATSGLKHQASPWGPAVFHQNAGTGHSGKASCLEFIGPQRMACPHTTNAYLIFMIVKPISLASTWNRWILTQMATAGPYNYLAIGIDELHTLLYHKTNTGIFETQFLYDYGALERDDGWQRWAFLEVSNQSGYGSRTDVWFENKPVVTGQIGYPQGAEKCNSILVGTDTDRKDGSSWHGLIAQIACIDLGNFRGAVNAMIQHWYDDPWWFLRSERHQPVFPACPHGKVYVGPAVSGDSEVGDSVSGELVFDEAVSGESSVFPAVSGKAKVGPAVSGVVELCEDE